MNWLLPEYTADALPHEAAQIERLRRAVLDLFRVHGYELVMPPLIEYLDSLLTGSGSDLKLRTFKLVDQLSGRTLGVRADMTPQVARIDAHTLRREGPSRLCYAGSVVHAQPRALTTSRSPIQLGAELYGDASPASDVEVISLLVNTLERTIAAARFESMLFPKHLPINLRIEVTKTTMKRGAPSQQTMEHGDSLNLPLLQEFRDSIYSNAEKQYLHDLMALTDNNIVEACRVSGLSQSRLYALLKKQGIQLQH